MEINKEMEVKMKSKEKTLYIRRARKQKALRSSYFVGYMPQGGFALYSGLN